MRSTIFSRATYSLCFISAIFSSLSHCGRPDWVEKRPIIPSVYVGIGMTQKHGPSAEYTEVAKNIALNDIASQITVSISSDVLRKVFESNEKLGEEFQSQIRTSAKAELEGVQLVDTYEDGDEYWVYFRLSKADYESRRADRMANAIAMSLDLFSKGRSNEKTGDFTRAIGLYAQAFGPIEKYLAEPLEALYEGRRVLLVNEIYTSLQSLVGRIVLTAMAPKRDATIGRPLKPPLELTATVEAPKTLPVERLPLTFKFIRGSGNLVEHALTDKNGIARCEVHKITASERIQMIEGRINLHDLFGGDSVSPVVQTVMSSIPISTIKFVLNVSGVDVVVDADESMFGKKLQQNRIEPVLKSQLGEKGFAFVIDVSKAALTVSIKADARKGAEMQGLAFAYVSATVSVLDMETGQEIFKSSVEDMKEGSDTYEKAAYKAFSSAANRIAQELIPKLVEKVQK